MRFSEEEIKKRLEKIGKLAVEELPISKVRGVICTASGSPVPMLVLEPAPEKISRKFYKALMVAFDKKLQPMIAVKDDGTSMVIEFVEPVKVETCQNKVEKKGKVPMVVAMDKPECAEVYRKIHSKGFAGIVVFETNNCEDCDKLSEYLFGGGLAEEDEGLFNSINDYLATNTIVINVDDCKSFVSAFNLSKFPTVAVFVKGKEIGRVNGFDKGEIKSLLTLSTIELSKIYDALDRY